MFKCVYVRVCMCSSKQALALNDPKRLICHKTL